MRSIILALLCLLFSAGHASAGVLNWFYTPPAVTMHKRELKQERFHSKQATRAARRGHSYSAPRYGIHAAPAPARVQYHFYRSR